MSDTTPWLPGDEVWLDLAPMATEPRWAKGEIADIYPSGSATVFLDGVGIGGLPRACLPAWLHREPKRKLVGGPP